MTEYSENLSLVTSENGRRSYHFETPLLEGYTLAREPYREFRKGIRMTTFLDDSLSTVDAVLTANYAIHYPERDLWEAKGDVVVEKSDGKKLYTQQLFWNARTKKIYSNVDTKFVQGRNVTIGEGFESDEEFKDWRFRRQKGRIETEFKPRPRQSELPDENAETAPAPFGKPSTAQPAAGKAASEDAPGKPDGDKSTVDKAAGPASGNTPVDKSTVDKPAGKPLSEEPSTGPAAGGKPAAGKAGDTEAAPLGPTVEKTDSSRANAARQAVRREAPRDSASAVRNRPASDVPPHKNE